MLSVRCLSVRLSCPVCDVGVLWPNGWMDQDETWHASKPQPWLHCVTWGVGTQLPLPQRGRVPQFSAYICCGRKAGCIKMLLGIELGLSPGDFVLDGDPAPPSPKGHRPPIFGLYLLRPNGCIDQDATWYGAKPQPRRLCVRRDPAP